MAQREKGLVVGIAADDAVQKHDVRPRDRVRVLRCIHDPPVDASFEAVLAGERPRLGLVGR